MQLVKPLLRIILFVFVLVDVVMIYRFLGSWLAEVHRGV
jgi:hypothetical protein